MTVLIYGAGHHTHWESPEAYLSVFYGTEVPRTAAHESSTLQGIRPDTGQPAAGRHGPVEGAQEATGAAL